MVDHLSAPSIPLLPTPIIPAVQNVFPKNDEGNSKHGHQEVAKDMTYAGFCRLKKNNSMNPKSQIEVKN